MLRQIQPQAKPQSSGGEQSGSAESRRKPSLAIVCKPGRVLSDKQFQRRLALGPRCHIEGASTEQAKDYLRHVLTGAFPKAEEMAEGVRVTRVVKDVTWNTLNEPGFIDWLKEQFPLRKDLQQPFELYRAAREALKSKPRQA
jgi:hypothetical protein